MSDPFSLLKDVWKILFLFIGGRAMMQSLKEEAMNLKLFYSGFAMSMIFG